MRLAEADLVIRLIVFEFQVCQTAVEAPSLPPSAHCRCSRSANRSTVDVESVEALHKRYDAYRSMVQQNRIGTLLGESESNVKTEDIKLPKIASAGDAKRSKDDQRQTRKLFSAQRPMRFSHRPHPQTSLRAVRLSTTFETIQ